MNNYKSNTRLLQIMNIFAFVAVVVMNGLATALPLNGRATGEISDDLPSFFTPAGYTFSIWGLIYLALLGYAVYQALPSQKRPYPGRIGWLFVVSSVFNIAWLFAWHYAAYTLSVLFMVALLVSLILIFRRLNVGRPDPSLTIWDRVLVQVPFSIYLGWITVATIANIASVANYFGWNGFGIAEPIWSAIMMLVAVVVAGLLLWQRQALAYAGVLVWALFGIRAAFPDVAVVANTAVIAAILIILLAIIGTWRTRQRQPAIPTQPKTA